MTDTDPETPRAYTEVEMEEIVSKHIRSIVRAWSTMPRENIRRDFNLPEADIDYAVIEAYMKHAAEGVAHSIRALLNGQTLATPALALIPDPHPEDKQYHILHGENWWDNTKSFRL